jgi:hypothetical protein
LSKGIQRAIGHNGYKGEPDKITITQPGDSVEVEKFKARAKSCHETFNGRVKWFQVLVVAFRRDFDQTSSALKLCVLPCSMIWKKDILFFKFEV